MYSTAAKNSMLNAIGITHLSLHDGYPGTTGTNELTGGSPAYARKSVTFASASGGSKASSTTPVFDVPAGKTVRWIGYWDALTSGNFLGAVPNGGSEKEFTTDIAGSKLLSNAHGYANGDKVVLSGTTPPTGLTIGTVYFVISSNTNDFQVSATSGGSAISLTGSNSYDCTVSKIVEETFSAQGQHQISSLTLNLNG
ncbi:MAG: phage tail fiber protein [Usitatibacter sp.]